MSWTSFEHVQEQYEKSLEASRIEWVEAKIDAAERLLASKRPNLQALIDTGLVPVENVRDAVVAAVLRVIRNPEGYQSETEGNYVYSVSRDVAGGKLFFTADDLLLVSPARSTGVGAIQVSIPAYRLGP